MKKFFQILLIASFAIFIQSCTTIDQRDTGLKIHTLSSDKGSIEVLTPGMYSYNPFTCDIVKYPSSVINYPFTASSDEGSANNEEFVINTKDNMAVTFDAAIDCSVLPEMAPKVYKKYRMDFESIVKTRYRNYMRDVFNNYASKLTYDELTLSLNEFKTKSDSTIKAILKSDGVTVERISFLSNLRPPKELNDAILDKIKASQITSQKQQEIIAARADSAKLIIGAKAQAYANELLAKKLDDKIVQLEWIKAWKETGGKVPQYVAAGQTMFMMPK